MKRRAFATILILAGLFVASFHPLKADEGKLVPLQTALSNTTISGYVDVAGQYNLSAASAPATHRFDMFHPWWWPFVQQYRAIGLYIADWQLQPVGLLTPGLNGGGAR